MHATIPALPEGFQQLMITGIKNGELNGELEGLFDRGAGRLLAHGMATLIKLGFGFLVNDDLDVIKSKKAQAFFEDNFILRDTQASGGVRYYQGKFLIRTRKAEDDMNVYIRFCPNPDRLYKGNEINHHAIVSAEAITEKEAEKIENNPDKVDLVIRFKDIKSILDLVERPDVDPVQLLLENQVQLTGNFGHMFKFGAIGKSAQQAIGE